MYYSCMYYNNNIKFVKCNQGNKFYIVLLAFRYDQVHQSYFSSVESIINGEII